MAQEKESRMSQPNRWSNKCDFFMTALSSTVGLGNLWRFPYVCYRNGGGAFLIPFMLMTILIGFPLVTLELTMGQFGRRGPVGVWKMCPLFEGIGWSMLLMNLVCNTYYVMLMGYTVFYIAASFRKTLPWGSCSNTWNTDSCTDEGSNFSNISLANTSFASNVLDLNQTSNGTQLQYKFPSEEYFYNHVLDISGGISEMGGPQWTLALCLLFAWAFVILALSLGTKSWEKLSYVTALLPYVVMLALLIQACLMPGSKDGILYFISPDWRRLGDGQVWAEAAVQVFFSVGCGWGMFLTLGKHNSLKDNPIRDAMILILGDTFTSIFCGIVIFAVLGQMSHQIAAPIEGVVDSGPGLAFIIYPRAVLEMPLPHFWAVLFFLMLFNLGLGSAIVQLANILVTVQEIFPVLNSRRNHLLTLLLLAVCIYLMGLMYSTRGGFYLLTLVDTYGPPLCLLCLGLLEVLVVAWIYGSRQVLRDLSFMTGYGQCYFYIAFWNVLTPIAILGVMVSFISGWRPVCVNDYCLPPLANALGWTLTAGEVAVIPAFMIYKLATTGRKQGFCQLLRPADDWGEETRKPEHRKMLDSTKESTSI